MAEIIVFYIPPAFVSKAKYVPEANRGKVIKFKPKITAMSTLKDLGTIVKHGIITGRV